MVTLSKHAMRVILQHLDGALAETRRADGDMAEGMASWRIRMARDWLLEVAIADVAVEQIPTPTPMQEAA